MLNISNPRVRAYTYNCKEQAFIHEMVQAILSPEDFINHILEDQDNVNLGLHINGSVNHGDGRLHVSLFADFDLSLMQILVDHGVVIDSIESQVNSNGCGVRI